MDKKIAQVYEKVHFQYQESDNMSLSGQGFES